MKEDLEMAKINIRERNPEHYAKVKVEQEALIKKCSAQLGIARLCPYCEHKVSIVLRGEHSYSKEKCPNCGENVVFPPISFRLAHNVS